MRFFNTAGPVNCKDHYCVPPLHRFDLDDIMFLIQQKKYFVLHAPRQVGKTSYLLALMKHLNQSGNHACLYANVEVGQAARENVEQAMLAILGEITSRLRDFLDDDSFSGPTLLAEHGPHGALNNLLTQWAKKSAKPTVLLIDEIDSLVGDTLISVLRQLRAGYDKRPAMFPQSIILCGVRDVRDYRLRTDEGKAVVTGGSAFNIKAKSLRLGSFTEREIEVLYQQHTQETGQNFSEGVMPLIWELTQGQPWLINALGYEVCFEVKAGRDRSKAITPQTIIEAKENIIQRRETHLDQLVDKLKEARVQSVIEPILAGQTQPEKLVEDDVLYVRDLGLITTKGNLRIANKIYQEVIPRTLTYTTQLTIVQEAAWYVGDNGQLNIDKLLTAFQQFFREHSQHWVERFDYKEAGPQLLLQAFLQRIINSGGRIEREYGLGRNRTDLLLVWPYTDGIQKVILELKIKYGALQKIIDEGLEQTWDYMDTCNTTEGHLIIFDRDENKPWQEKIFRREENYQGQPIMVWGM